LLTNPKYSTNFAYVSANAHNRENLIEDGIPAEMTKVEEENDVKEVLSEKTKRQRYE
jgi:hypothetical protein